jgi:hypothetical protein
VVYFLHVAAVFRLDFQIWPQDVSCTKHLSGLDLIGITPMTLQTGVVCVPEIDPFPDAGPLMSVGLSYYSSS